MRCLLSKLLTDARRMTHDAQRTTHDTWRSSQKLTLSLWLRWANKSHRRGKVWAVQRVGLVLFRLAEHGKLIVHTQCSLQSKWFCCYRLYRKPFGQKYHKDILVSFSSLAVVSHIQREVIQTYLLSFGSPRIIWGLPTEFLFTMASQRANRDVKLFPFPQKTKSCEWEYCCFRKIKEGFSNKKLSQHDNYRIMHFLQKNIHQQMWYPNPLWIYDSKLH